jgi:murein L,D-transpeptidase YafK
MTAQSVPLTVLDADHVVMLKVVVLKNGRRLELLGQSKGIRIDKAALGGDPVGPKTRQGDHKTPESVYVLDFRKAYSPFYKSIPVSSPSERDRHLPDRRAFRPEEKLLRLILLAEIHARPTPRRN